MRTSRTPFLPAALTLASLLVAPRASAQVYTLTCSTASGTDCRSQIPDARGDGVTTVPGVLDSTVTLAGGCPAVADIDLTYRYRHDWLGDLAFEVVPPTGPALGAGDTAAADSRDDFDATQPVFLTSFPGVVGINGTGAWTLRVTDRRNSGVGALEDWTLSVVCQTGVAVIPTVTIDAVDALAGESPYDPGTFVVRRNIVDANPLTVFFTISGTASAADYTAIPLSVTIPAGQAWGLLTVSPIADGVAEPPETVVVTLVDVPEYDPGAPASATVTISDQAAQLAIPTLPRAGLLLLALGLAAAGAAFVRFLKA